MDDIQDACFKFNITVSTSLAEIVPVTHWFDRIEILERSSGNKIERQSSDIMLIKLASMPGSKLSGLSDLVAFDPQTFYKNAKAVRLKIFTWKLPKPVISQKKQSKP